MEYMEKSQKYYRKIQGLVGESSFSVVLPKQFATSIGISKGDFVKVSLENDVIIIRRAE